MAVLGLKSHYRWALSGVINPSSFQISGTNYNLQTPAQNGPEGMFILRSLRGGILLKLSRLLPSFLLYPRTRDIHVNTFRVSEEMSPGR
jgi:hypothetical protein